MKSEEYTEEMRKKQSDTMKLNWKKGVYEFCRARPRYYHYKWNYDVVLDLSL